MSEFNFTDYRDIKHKPICKRKIARFMRKMIKSLKETGRFTTANGIVIRAEANHE